MHMFYRVMKGIYQFAANLLSYIPTKYYWNRSTSDLVIAKSRRVNFFWNTVYNMVLCNVLLDRLYVIVGLYCVSLALCSAVTQLWVGQYKGAIKLLLWDISASATLSSPSSSVTTGVEALNVLRMMRLAIALFVFSLIIAGNSLTHHSVYCDVCLLYSLSK